MALRSGPSGNARPPPQRRGHRAVVHTVAPTPGVAGTRTSPPPPAPPSRAPRQLYTLTEIHGTEERDLLAPSSPNSTPPPHPIPAIITTPNPRPPPSTPLSSLPVSLRDLFLPPGFPASVTPDYLPYQLWSLPTHVTGHLSHALVTSSLLAAVGVSAAPAATVALSASIKWIVKDGVGALGRLIVGSRFSAEFDEDPRRWRLVAELLSTAGLGLEVATAAHPQSFLLLACAGKFCQALGKGMGKPVFRVIQTHFARAQNVGAVAAKEEVWEVVAQMAGLAASVALLRALEGSASAGSFDGVVGAWAATQTVHVALRYRALTTLTFTTLSTKRAALLAAAVLRGRPLPSVAEANAAEPVFADPWDVQPRLRLGVSAAEAFGGGGGEGGRLPPAGVLQAYAVAYEREGYLLVWRNGTAWVVLKEGHTPGDLLRAVWQAAWLDWRTADGGGAGAGGGGGGIPALEAAAEWTRTSEEQGEVIDTEVMEEVGEDLRLVRASLAALEAGFGGFLAACEAAGWEVGVVQMKAGRSRLRVGTSRAEQGQQEVGEKGATAA